MCNTEVLIASLNVFCVTDVVEIMHKSHADSNLLSAIIARRRTHIATICHSCNKTEQHCSSLYRDEALLSNKRNLQKVALQKCFIAVQLHLDRFIQSKMTSRHNHNYQNNWTLLLKEGPQMMFTPFSKSKVTTGHLS